MCVYQLPAFTLPNNFAFPETFLPERWLPANHPDRPKATLSDKQEVFQPFSVGPKACLGKGLAYAEIKKEEILCILIDVVDVDSHVSI